MTFDIVLTVLVALAIAVGCVGIVVPILPGSILLGLSVLVWAIFIGGAPGWVTFSVVAVLVSIGMAASWFLTGRKLKEMQVPTLTLLVSGVLAVVGFFVVPVVGLLLGFVLGLFVMEYSRLKDAPTAWQSSWQIIKTAGVGMIVEFSCAALAAGMFAGGVVWHFLTT